MTADKVPQSAATAAVQKGGHMPRYRTIRAAAEEIKKMDAETAITEHYIRSLCKDCAIPTRQAGNKTLLNLDVLIRYLNEPHN
jgi:hypothetical protein